ncbi:MAG: S46 family peptidase [Bacteroidetes bacterium]|nr:S46 family peptidase [Bacteroidota bacterium]
MKKLLLFAFIMMSLCSFRVNASPVNPPDEGMWLPMFIERLNYVDMQKMGLHLTAEELYSINHSSLKDAIVNFGNFCTAEVVSNEGLLLTNHHCGYEALQKHSSIEHDYLTNGFWAYNKSEEIPTEGLTATFLIRMEDVTKKVLANVSDTMSLASRRAAISKVNEKLKKEAGEKGKYLVDIKSFFDGNEYYMFVYEVYEDVRLVGAPPSAIGKFGGDTDNWMWPRHTGDFSMFRVYATADGKPSKFDKTNVPLKPKHVLPISIKGVKKSDYAMIWGYPGSTERYMTSYGVQSTLELANPAIINAGNIMLPIMKKDMDADQAVKIKYASTYAQLANVWKNKIGESKGLKKLKVYDKKKALENELQLWIDADPARKAKYGNVISDMATTSKQLLDLKAELYLWYFQGILMSSKTMLAPLQLMGMSALLEKKDTKPEAYNDYKEIMKELYKDCNLATEKKLFAAGLELYKKEVPANLLPDIFELINKEYKGDIQKFTDEAFKESMMVSEESFAKFIKKPNAKKFKNDLVNKTTTSIYNMYMKLNMEQKDINTKLNTAKRLFMAALREMQPNKKFYPNANFTMRMTYGQVLDYTAADAVQYDYVTHLSGVMEKEDPTNDEFIVPVKLKELYKNKDFGRYGSNGDLVTCFLTTNDITGGNSGSPVINGDGQLIGLAFDGNWEAMSGDVAFEPELQRTICVDIRYVLFCIDKMANAQNLIKEMNIIE